MGLASAALLVASASAIAQDTSRDLLPRSVSQFGLQDPYLYYAAPARCTTQFGGTPADYQASLRSGPIVNELEPVQIILRDNVTGARRLVWEFSPPRAPGQCNPYHIVSNVSWDAEHLYWMDDTYGLQRLSRKADPGDPAQLVLDLLFGSTAADSRIIDAGPRLFIYSATNFDVGFVLSYVKASGGVSLIDSAKPPARLEFDGRYLYYLDRKALFPERGTLRRWDSQTGQIVDAAHDVTAFRTVFYDLTCEPEIGCRESSVVLIATSRRVFQRDTVGGGFDLDQYVSPSPQGVVYEMLIEGNRVYLFEERPTLQQPSFFNDQLLVRIPAFGSSGTQALLLKREGDRMDGLTTAPHLADVYWRHRAEGTLEVAAKNLAPLPQVELAITGIEVNQEVQDLATSVRLVEGKRTFVRVHARSTGGAEVPGIEAVLRGSRSGVPLGEVRPVNPTGATLTLLTAPQRQNLNDSFLFELPWSWLEDGPLRLDAEINADDRPIEGNRADNTATRIVSFSTAHTLVIQLVDFNWNLGTTNFTVSDAEVAATSGFTRAIYPVSDLGGYADQLLDSGLLLVTRRQIFDGDLGTRVDRSAAECGTDDPSTPGDDRNVCAANRTNARLREMKARGELNPRFFAYGFIPSAAGNNALFPRGWAAGGVGSGPSFDPDYMAHEVGHLLGRGHPAAASGPAPGCGHDAVDAGYPYPGTALQPAGANLQTSFAGFDQQTSQPLLSSFDIMGYCSPEWISDYTFEAMYQEISTGTSGGGSGGGSGSLAAAVPAAPPQPMAGDWLIVIGDLDPVSGDTALRRIRRVGKAYPLLADMGPYRLEQRSLAGSLLSSWDFDTLPIEDAASPRASFELVVPFEAGARTLRVVEISSGDVLASKPVSASPPVVSGVALAGALNPVKSVVQVMFGASDADGGALRFDLLLSSDGGATWRTLVSDAAASPITVDTTGLPGGPGRFRVEATDGVLTGMADSPSFTVANKRPAAEIVSPRAGTHVRYDQIVNLQGGARDAQDGAVLDAGLAWTDDLGHVLGHGSRVTVGALPLGLRTLTLTATNSLGLVGNDRVEIVVEEQVGVPGPTLTVDPPEITIQVGDGTTSSQQASIAVGNAGAGVATFTATVDSGWIGLGAMDGTTPAVLALTLDPSSLADDTTHEGHVLIASVSPPGQSASVLVRLVKGVPFDGSGPADRDLDGVSDDADNCSEVANTDQTDSNGDRYGNVCDADLTGDGIVNFADLAILRSVFFSSDPDADLTGDGNVNFSDLARLRAYFFKPPGPSGRVP